MGVVVCQVPIGIIMHHSIAFLMMKLKSGKTQHLKLQMNGK